MLKIGRIELDDPFILAPLAGVSDLPFRLINRRAGCGFGFIEMISVHALTFKNKKTLRLLESTDEDRPLGLQLLGKDPDVMLKALERIKPYNYDVIDLNAACPVRKVVRRGEGAAMMQDPSQIHKVLSVMVRELDCPVTVKIRAGWDHDSINAVDVARAAEDAGVAAVFIHGRTRAQMYSGEVNRDAIREVKQSVGIPVIASGDIFSPAHAKEAFDQTGCDGLVMARGAMGNPWIFPHTKQYLSTGALPHRPTLDEITDVMTEHLALCRDFYGDVSAASVFRKFFIWYSKGISGVKPLRVKAVNSKDAAEMQGNIDELRASGAEVLDIYSRRLIA